MADLLIKHLNKKALEHSDLKNLLIQWDFDEKIIPKALQNIANLFPHYSRHDASHSRSILINIERLLGQENIDRLTATDTWLLLESAFLHDIGMIVPQSDKEKAWADPRFHELIESISQDRGNDLQNFCFMLTLQKSKSSLQLTDMGCSILEASEQLTFLMAEWFRVSHPQRANDIIQNPKTSIGLNSPRTELIPKRLFKLLGSVCEMHGSNFDLLFSDNGLPYREAGLATEDCHPRYIACLLRLGDLLDMDDNRFCPVMMGIAGEHRPDMSKAHEAKHAGITHLRIDRDRIEVSSECTSVDSYLEAYNWSKWIEGEIQNQMAHWGDIVPSRDFGPLPTLGECKVSLAGEYTVLNDGERPEFSLDQKHATKLLQGENLYDSKFTCIRELIQNAVDSTLIRHWLELGSGKNRIDFSTINSDKVAESLESKPIEIEFSEVSSDITEENLNRWVLKIEDHGTGISKEDLKYMLRISGSRGNNKRQGIIKGMPEWMKPSGCFGIGFQSLFMITDRVKIITKSIVDDEMLEIIMHDPTGNKQGLVLIKSLEKDISIPHGCTLYLDIEFAKIPDRWSVGGNNRVNSIKVLNNFDPQLSVSLPVQAASLVDSIEEYSSGLIIPVKLRVQSKELSGESELVTKINSYKYIDVNGPVLIDFSFEGSEYIRNISSKFRGQSFEIKHRFFEYVNFNFDLLVGKAEAWLKFNRKEIKADAITQLTDLLRVSLLGLIEAGVKDFANFKEMNDNPVVFSLFLKSMAEQYGRNENKWIELSNRYDTEWHKYKVNDFTISEILELDSWSLMEKSNLDFNLSDEQKQKQNENNNIDIIYNYNQSVVVQLLAGEYIKMHCAGVKIGYDSNDNEIYTYSKNSKNLIDDTTVSKSIANKIKNNDIYSSCRRYFLYDVDNRWVDLHIDNEEVINAKNLFKFYIPPEPRILIPHLFTVDGAVELTSSQLDGVVNWVLPKLLKRQDIDSLKKSYRDFIKHIDELMENSENCVKWSKACKNRTDY